MRKMQNYVVIEGVDGTGKTTTLKALATAMMADNKSFLLTKEPGGPYALQQEWNCGPFSYPFAESYQGFRDLCVNNPQIPHLVKRGLYKADSFYNWLAVVKPALEQGITVLSDRSWVSDLAYGTVLAGNTIEALSQFNIALVPEQAALTRVIYLTCPEHIREARLEANIADHADKIGVIARNSICEAYLDVLSSRVKEFRVIDTAQSIETVVRLCKEFVYAKRAK